MPLFDATLADGIAKALYIVVSEIRDSRRGSSAILLHTMGEEYFFCANLQIRDEPAKDHCRRNAPEELSDYKPRHIDGSDARECITEASRNCDRRVGKRGRCCKPVSRHDVGPYGERYGI